MRTLRNSLILLAFGAYLAEVSHAQAPTSAHGPLATRQNAYFPLAVGNNWSYRCSAEGRFLFYKKVQLASVTTVNGLAIYRAETRTGSDSKPLVSYLMLDPGGRVMTSLKPASDSAELLMSATPRIGERLGKFSVVTLGHSTLKKYRNTEVVQVENFSLDDPKLPEEKRLEWLGRSYGKGIGLLEESDGLGGSCVLSGHGLKGTR